MQLRLRRVEPWTVARFAAVAYLSLGLMCLVAATVLWVVGRMTGALASIEHLVGQLRSSPGFHFDGAKLIVLAAAGALVLALAGALAGGVATALFNLTSDVVGGMDVTVHDGGGPPRPPPKHRRRRRREPGRARPSP
ncbi:MAG TPA: DUF3566 domain-containing protein [Acidimicrobiales bacterium]|nr:DUF3566 domain-containing protein [Acidimicrobiales bacterium]